MEAPKLTMEYLVDQIVDEFYIIPRDIAGISFADSTLTVCVLKLKSGFEVIGHSACVSPENFDPVIGHKIAKGNAVNKLWELEGYLLKNTLN